jgi:DNA-binding IscR family transcriptional regulator
VPPEEIVYDGVAEPLSDVWLALRASMRRVIERVTLADIVNGPLPDNVRQLIAGEEAWRSG